MPSDKDSRFSGILNTFSLVVILVLVVSVLLFDNQSITGLAETKNIIWTGSDVFYIHEGESIFLDLRAYFKEINRNALTFLSTETPNAKVHVNRYSLEIIPQQGFSGEDEIILIASNGPDQLKKDIQIIVGSLASSKTFLPPEKVTISPFYEGMPMGFQRKELSGGLLRVLLADVEYDLSTLEKRKGDKAYLDLRALNELIMPKFGRVDDDHITTHVFAIKDVDIKRGSVMLITTGDVSAIFQCNDFSFSSFSCENWEITDIPFEDKAYTITFRIDEAGVYAGGIEEK